MDLFQINFLSKYFTIMGVILKLFLPILELQMGWISQVWANSDNVGEARRARLLDATTITQQNMYMNFQDSGTLAIVVDIHGDYCFAVIIGNSTVISNCNAEL
jgi:hypothetical protein